MPTSRKPSSFVTRHIALCYVRLSYTRDEHDLDSPERQRANIQAECDRRGWTCEWYEDVEGHKSGQSERNRPGWLSLKSRLGDPDVVAIVANDLARLHRKGWRVGDLIDFAEEHNVQLVMAAPGRTIDLSGPMGRMSVMIAALMDEYYAIDISRRAKDSIAHRKRQGRVINIPFGTQRRKDGYLEPSTEGGWWLSDGRFVGGTQDNPPDEGGVWRSYFETAFRGLTLYCENRSGVEQIAYQLNIEGFPFRGRDGQPRPVNKDDVRRMVRNWPEYGGLVPELASKKRHPREQNLDSIQFVPERSVFHLSCSMRWPRSISSVLKTQ